LAETSGHKENEELLRNAAKELSHLQTSRQKVAEKEESTQAEELLLTAAKESSHLQTSGHKVADKEESTQAEELRLTAVQESLSAHQPCVESEWAEDVLLNLKEFEIDTSLW